MLAVENIKTPFQFHQIHRVYSHVSLLFFISLFGAFDSGIIRSPADR